MDGSLDLLAVWPNNRLRAFGSLGEEVAAISPPVQDGLTAAYVRNLGWTADVLDAEAADWMPADVAAEVERRRPRLVMVSSDQVNTGDVTKMAAAGETVRAIKNRCPDVPVLLEGVVPSAYPERMLREEGADYACQGEAYDPVVALLAVAGIWARYGDEVVPSVRSPPFKEVDRLPLTAWDLMPPSRYRAHHWHCFDRLSDRTPYASIFTNFGCPYGCTFCSVNVVAGGPNFRAHTPGYVLNEIDLLVKRYGVRNIRILDNVFTIRQDLVEELCDGLIARGYDLNLWAYARVESVRSPDLLRKMRRAGIRWLAYGIEAAHERVRSAVEKSSSQKVIDRAIEWTQEAGIWIVGNFIFGLPEDDLESMRMSLDMAKRWNFEWANFYFAMAYPGARLHDQMVAEGVEMPRDWSAYGQYSPNARPLSTRYVDWRQIVKFRDEAFMEYYTNPAYLGMIQKKFGPDSVAFVRRILAEPMRRNLA